MRIVKLPSGEYYLEKSARRGGNPFVFSAKASGEDYYIFFGRGAILPKELINHKVMFKVEIVEPKEAK